MATRPPHPFSATELEKQGVLIPNAQLRLLTKLRNAAVDMANTADVYEDYVHVNRGEFDGLIRWIIRLMNFEEHHGI
jgi:hypothetical protein